MRYIQRYILLVACLPLFGCASAPTAWWDEQQPQGQPGKVWTQRYTAHSFSRDHTHVKRDATKQLQRWAEWKCPVAGYETRAVRVVETPPPPQASGLLALYYGSGLGIRQSLAMEMDITCRDPNVFAENTAGPHHKQ